MSTLHARSQGRRIRAFAATAGERVLALLAVVFPGIFTGLTPCFRMFENGSA
jgi:hypothetical protein